MNATLTNDRLPVRVRTGRILIAEDDGPCRWAIQALLRRLGYESRAARDGEEAVEMAHAFAPQVILMDLMMPVVDGLEAIRRLKSDAATRAIPILVLTANVTPQGEAEARLAGCDAMMTKPIILADLLGKLDALLGG